MGRCALFVANRRQLWTRLEELGEPKVRQMLAAGTFQPHEQVEVREWLKRKEALSAASGSKLKLWIALAGSIAAIVGAIVAIVASHWVRT